MAKGQYFGILVYVPKGDTGFWHWKPSVDLTDPDAGKFQFAAISIGLIAGGAWPLAWLVAPFIGFDVKWWLEGRRNRKTVEQSSESLSKGSWHWPNRRSARSVFPAPDDTVCDWSLLRRSSKRPEGCFESSRQAFTFARDKAWSWGHDMPSPWGAK